MGQGVQVVWLAGVVAVGAAALPACRSMETSREQVGYAEELPGTWVLVQAADPELDGLIPKDRPPEVTFAAGGGVAGFAGVNRFTSALESQELERGSLAWRSEMAVTRMAGPPEAMELEERFLDALRGAGRYSIEGDRLVLSEGDEASLTFVRSE